MKPITVAYDKPQPDAIDHVWAWMQSSPSVAHWALVEGALLSPELVAAYSRLQDWKPINALALSGLRAYGVHAPQLIALHADPERQRADVDALLRMTKGAPVISWIRSEYPVEALQHLAKYLGVAHVDGHPKAKYCRFADLCTLPALLDVLSPAQYLRVTDVVQSWGWFNRQGNWQEWPTEAVAAPPTKMDNATYLRYSAEQFQAMLKHDEADVLYARLLARMPAALPLERGSALHHRLQGYLHTASELHIADNEDRFQFVVLSLDHGENFHRCEQLATSWQAIREQGASLAELKDAWSADIWTALSTQGEPS